MKKRLTIVLATLTLVVGSSYYLTGKLIQKNYYVTVAKLNNPSKVKVNLLDYDRGIFHSMATLEVTVPGTTPGQTLTFAIQQKITHGPIVAVMTPDGFRVKLIASEIKTTLEREFAKKLEDALGTQEPFKITTLVSFNDQATTWFNIAGGNQTAESNLTVSWEPVLGIMQHDLHFSTYQSSLKLPKLSIKGTNTDLNITELELSADASEQNKNSSYIHAISVKDLVFNKLGTDQVTLKDLVLKLKLTETNATALDITLTASIAESQIVQQKFAQDTAKLEISNLPIDTLPSTAILASLSTREALDFMQRLTMATNSNLTLELPKHFTEAMLSYVSFELYKTSFIGKADNRPDAAVLHDITASINSLVQGALRQKLFIDQGAFYALNFAATMAHQDLGTTPPTQLAPPPSNQNEAA